MARIGEGRGMYRFLMGIETTGEIPATDGRIILRWIFRKWDVGVWTRSRWLWIGTGGGNL